jgi:HPt (histidine-containing phosphotransfer) domain-containing protein
MGSDETILTSGGPGVGTSLLDPGAVEALRELVGGDPETLVDITDAFLEEAPQRLDDLRQGLEESDAELAGRAAHTLKSNALTFGALDLAADCRDIEAAARDGSLSGARGLVDRVESGWEPVRAALISLRDEASG